MLRSVDHHLHLQHQLGIMFCCTRHSFFYILILDIISTDFFVLFFLYNTPQECADKG